MDNGMKVFAVLVCLSLIFCAGREQSEKAPHSQGEIVILISIDGCRYDYPLRVPTPALDSIAAHGVRAEGLIPVFPSKTFPNHYSQVTGLYPEHHGIIANRMWDPVFNENFRMGGEQDGRVQWFEGEPLWVTAKKQGMVAASFFWPGSDAEIMGVRPAYYHPYDGDIPYSTRVAGVLEWLRLPQDHRPQFITLYFEAVDNTGHWAGPADAAVDSALIDVDRHISNLLRAIDTMGLTVNVIVVSDHGMSPQSRERVILLDDYIDPGRVKIINYSPVADLIPEAGMEDEIYNRLKGAHPRLSVYRKAEIPPELHYNDHRRIPPLVCIADDGWSITTRSYFEKHPDAFNGGTHGYTPDNRSMHGIFYASGPAFQSGLVTERFECVHLYELICYILGLEPAPNDGDLGAVSSMLQD